MSSAPAANVALCARSSPAARPIISAHSLRSSWWRRLLSSSYALFLSDALEAEMGSEVGAEGAVSQQRTARLWSDSDDADRVTRSMAQCRWRRRRRAARLAGAAWLALVVCYASVALLARGDGSAGGVRGHGRSGGGRSAIASLDAQSPGEPDASQSANLGGDGDDDEDGDDGGETVASAKDSGTESVAGGHTSTAQSTEAAGDGDEVTTTSTGSAAEDADGDGGPMSETGQPARDSSPDAAFFFCAGSSGSDGDGAALYEVKQQAWQVMASAASATATIIRCCRRAAVAAAARTKHA